ncbi:MAG: hypothetical protein ACOZF0_01785 [Thermodesulfobacteriota bacterium]
MKPFKIISIVFAVTSALAALFAATAPAEPAGIVIRSRYLNPVTQAWDNEIKWRLVPRESGSYAVFRNDQAQPDLMLQYAATGRLMRIEDRLSGIYTHDTRAEETITLSWGYPFPLDDLNPGDSGQTQAVSRKLVGDTGFAYHLDKETRPITLAEAVAREMIPPDQAHVHTGRVLKLVSVHYGKSIRVRQLWAEGDRWWLYEDTGDRRSWRETH